MYSAIKVNGKKLYELARKGKEVERKPRPVTIHALTLEGQTAPDEFIIRVRCSKGTYVRTLCHDIGQTLGCGGTMSSLRRTMAAGFDLSQSVNLEQVQEHPQREELLLPVDAYFSTYPALTVEASAEKKIRNGMTLVMPQLTPGQYRVYGTDGAFLALCRAEQGKLITVKSFFEV
jgi:tRNA pseudouridine55 synthase